MTHDPWAVPSAPQPVIAPSVKNHVMRAHGFSEHNAPGWLRLTSEDSRVAYTGYHAKEPSPEQLAERAAKIAAAAARRAAQAEERRRLHREEVAREARLRAEASRRRQEERKAARVSHEERERRRLEGYKRWRASQVEAPKQAPVGYLPIAEAARQCGRAVKGLRSARAAGRLPYKKIEGRLYVRLDDCLAMIEAARQVHRDCLAKARAAHHAQAEGRARRGAA